MKGLPGLTTNSSGHGLSNGGALPPAGAARRRGGWFTVILAAVLLVVGVVVVAQFAPILYAIAVPPAPPRPENTALISTDPAAYGVETALYSSPDDACRVTRYYQSQGASCRIAPGVCDTGFVQMEQPRPATQVARCTADVPFSIFTMRYRAEIVAGYEVQTEDFPTRLRLEREIFWTGSPGDIPLGLE